MLTRAFRDFSTLVVGLALIFLAVNIVVGALFWARDRYLPLDAFTPAPVAEVQSVDLTPMYGGLSSAEISELRREMEGLPRMHEGYTQVRERPVRGKYYNIDEAGFRHSTEQSAWPPNDNSPIIYFFGNSTVAGFRIGDQHTIASHFTKQIRSQPRFRDAQIYNFGRGGYHVEQQQILLQKLIADERIPDFVFFVNGINDLEHDGSPPLENFISNLFDQSIASSQLTSQFSVLQLLVEAWRAIPLSRAIHWVRVRIFGDDHPARQIPELAPQSTGREPLPDVETLVSRYIRFTQMTKGMAEKVGFQTIYVWQPSPSYNFDLRHHPFAPPDNYETSRERIGYQIVAKDLNSNPPQDTFLWCGDAFAAADQPMFIDPVHYSPAAAKLVAQCIANGFVKMQGMSDG